MIFMTIVASTAFAYYLKGVTWFVSEGGRTGYTMYVGNSNDYRIYFKTSIGQSGILDAHAETYLNCYADTTLYEVTKY
jgi:hypothetical protein